MTEKLSIEELNTWIPLASLEALPVEEQKIRLQYWKEHFTNKEITAGLGTYNTKLYGLYKKLDITTQGTANPKRKRKNTTKKKEDTPTEPQLFPITEPVQTQTFSPRIPMQEIPVFPEVEPAAPSEPIEQLESFHIRYAGRKSKQKVIHQLQFLATLLEAESHEKYQFSIQIDTPPLR